MIDRDEQEYIQERLKEYIENSRLSMGQIAKKIGVSTSMLSQVKNKKKGVGLDLALKILKASGASFEDTTNWVDRYQNSSSEHFSDYKKQIFEHSAKSSRFEKITTFLDSNQLAMDLFLDVVLESESGINETYILPNYGKHGMSVLSEMVSMGLIVKRGNTFLIDTSEDAYVPTRNTMISMVKTISNRLKGLESKGNFDGHVSCYFTEIDEIGFQRLKNLHMEYAKEAEKIFQAHQRGRKQGGLRVNFSLLLGLIGKKR